MKPLSIKKAASFIIKILILTFILFISYPLSSPILDMAPISGGSPVLPLLLMSLLITLVMSNVIVHSKWTGYKLFLGITMIFFTVSTFLSQIETVVFLRYLKDIIPPVLIPRLFLQGVFITALFSLSAVTIYGKMRKIDQRFADERPFVFQKTMLFKIFLVSIIYVIIYFSFGMFVFMPLAGDAVVDYYGNLQLPVWIIPFQLVRGIIWGTVALTILRMMKGGLPVKAISVALVFSVLMGSLLLIPNDFMPDTVRYAHLVEVSSSNFLFGLISGWILERNAS